MRHAVTISLPAVLCQTVDSICAAEGLSRSDLVQQALRKWLIGRELEQARREITPYAEAAGFLTDDDVFRAVS